MRSAKCIRWQTKKALCIEVPCIWEYRRFLQGISFGFCHVLKDFAQGRIAISALVPWTIRTGNQQRTPEFGVSNSLGSGGRLLDWESTTQATTLTFFRFINSVSKLCFFGRGGVHLKSKRWERNVVCERCFQTEHFLEPRRVPPFTASRTPYVWQQIQMIRTNKQYIPCLVVDGGEDVRDESWGGSKKEREIEQQTHLQR